MSWSPAATLATVGSLSPEALRARLAGPGLRLSTGAARYCMRSRLPEVVAGVGRLYADHPLLPQAEFCDFHVSVDPGRGLRRWLRPQVEFGLDGIHPFAPLPGDQGLPMLEWGMNWCVSTHCHHFLILHAAVLERGGRALVMPAPSGSGKSTLCAALTFRGWRLLSDELALIDPATGLVHPNPRPVSLKNASIEVIRRFAGEAVRFDSIVHDTTKGTVGHFAPGAAALAAIAQPVTIGWFVLPAWGAGQAPRWQRSSRGEALQLILQNAFNHNLHRRRAFECAADLAERAQAWRLSYGRLEDVMPDFEALAQGHPPPAEAAG